MKNILITIILMAAWTFFAWLTVVSLENIHVLTRIGLGGLLLVFGIAVVRFVSTTLK